MSRMLELRRRALIAALMRKASGLPEGCVELEYIASTGTQYIDMGFKPNQDTRVVIKTRCIPGNESNYVFGARTSTRSNAFSFAASQNGYYTSGYGTTVGNISTDYNQSGFFVIDKNKNVTSINGVVVSTADEQTFSAPGNLYLFAFNTNGTANLGDLPICFCKVYDNGVLVRDCVSILDPSGVPCMYDKVNKEYLNNAGTGSFIPGYKLPDGCVELEYIASTGTQFLKTGFIPNQDTKIVVTVSGWDASETSTTLFGTQTASSDRYDLFITAGGLYRSYYAGSYVGFEGVSCAGKTRIVRDGTNISIGGTTLTNTDATFTCGAELYLMAHNTSGSASKFASVAFYPCQIYGNGSLARDYVPILDPSGVACVYDKVNRKYCYNAGTGSFVPGYKLPEGYTEREYIESTGTQHLDTGFKPNQNTRVVMDLHLQDSTGIPFVFGAWDGKTQNAYSVYWWTGNNAWGVDYSSQRVQSSETDWDKRLIIDLNKNVLTVDGTATTLTASTFTASATLTLLALNAIGKLEGYNASAKLYSTQSYNNVTPTRDYVPVTDASGVACAFDRIGNKTYYNAGSGSFIAGPEVTAA